MWYNEQANVVTMRACCDSPTYMFCNFELTVFEIVQHVERYDIRQAVRSMVHCVHILEHCRCVVSIAIHRLVRGFGVLKQAGSRGSSSFQSLWYDELRGPVSYIRVLHTDQYVLSSTHS